jgi:hypothetical protein
MARCKQCGATEKKRRREGWAWLNKERMCGVCAMIKGAKTQRELEEKKKKEN